MRIAEKKKQLKESDEVANHSLRWAVNLLSSKQRLSIHFRDTLYVGLVHLKDFLGANSTISED